MKKVILRFGEDLLMLWPDGPYVLAGKQILEIVVSAFYSGLRIDEVIFNIKEEYHEHSDIVDKYVRQIYTFLSGMKNNGKKLEYVLKDKLSLSMVTYNITKKCNLHCKHCYSRVDSTSTLTDCQIDKMMENINKIVVQEPKLFIISGGEPTLVKNELLYVIKRAADYEFNVRLNTNGYKIDDDIAQVCFENNVLVQVSIDGENEDTHAMMRGSKESFVVAIDAIKKLKEHKCRVRLSTTIHEKNYFQVLGIVKLVENLGAEQLVTSSLVNLGNAKKNSLESVGFEKEFETLFDVVKNSFARQIMTKSTLLAETICAIRAGLKFEYCGSGVSTCCIDTDGSVYPCINFVNNEFKLGNILSNDIIQSWINSNAYLRLSRLNVDTMNDDCLKCHFRYFCGSYCRAETYFNGGKITDKYIKCKEWKKGLTKIMEIIAKNPNIYNFVENNMYGVLHRE